MAWRDNNIVLFATTTGSPKKVIKRPRKRPNKTRTGAFQTRKRFGNEIVKVLEIPKLIDLYNHHMGAVDQFDQLKSYYDTARKHRKTWRSLFHMLLDIILVNCFKLSAFSNQEEKKLSVHRRFLLQLVAQLQEISAKPIKHNPRRQSDLQLQSEAIHEQKTLLTKGNGKPCVMCAAKGERRALKHRHTNTDMPARMRRTVKGCTVCQIAVCFEKGDSDCWKEHLQAVASASSEEAIN